jgi:hypothetical protein
LLTLSACESEVEPVSGQSFGAGIFIVNEGPFQSGSGTLSFHDRQTKEVRHMVYSQANGGASIGNIFQSMSIQGGKVYLVANNAGRMLVASNTTLRHLGMLDGLAQPRFCLPVSEDKACITQWGSDGNSGSLLLVDLTTFTVQDTIQTGVGPEQMLRMGNRLYVTNSGGIGGVDSTVTVIDIDRWQVTDQLVVGTNPVSLAATPDGAVWIGCAGYFDWADPGNPLNEAGRLVRLVEDKVDRTIPLSTGAHDLTSTGDGKRLLFLGTNYGSSVYQFSLENNQETVGTFLSGNYYALAVDPMTGHILVSDAMDFQSVGRVHIFDPAGQEQGAFDAGVIPGGFAFQ